MKKFYIEIAISILFVAIATTIIYGKLSGYPVFWTEQQVWSTLLLICWIIVSIGYFHQGWLVHTSHSASNVSIVLPIAVFIVQCILFIKGVFYQDLSLMMGAVIVNCGVTFNLFQIFRSRIRKKRG